MACGMDVDQVLSEELEQLLQDRQTLARVVKANAPGRQRTTTS